MRPHRNLKTSRDASHHVALFPSTRYSFSSADIRVRCSDGDARADLQSSFFAHRSTAQFFALVRKNFTLKTRGILCCCTGVEIILPVFFLAVLCLPKALVKDSVNNDVVTKPYQIATPWGSTEYSGGRGPTASTGTSSSSRPPPRRRRASRTRLR